MTIDQVGSLVSLIVSALTLVTTVFVVVTRLAKVEVKVETMWDLHLRNAVMGAVSRGAATLNSPLIITVEAQSWCDSLKEDLQAWHAGLPKPITDRELIMAVGKNFGDRLLHEVCIPREVYEGVCLLIAAAVAKNDGIIILPELDDKSARLSATAATVPKIA